MRLSFVLAIVAALTAFMAVSADSECYTAGGFCNSDKDCCHGYECVAVYNYHFDEVVVAFLVIQIESCSCFSIGAAWLMARHMSSSLRSASE
ncbi:hypothetical protein EDB19DRAFT_1708487 [Suillus lakei]|nr:hypothetical protein EDB19DRAFT_1708487 [Suillus lakei]